MLAIANDAWQTGGAIGVSVVAIQAAFGFAKYAMGSRRNGSANAGHSAGHAHGNGSAAVFREHGERLASLETSFSTLNVGQQMLFKKMDCIDRKLTQVLAERAVEQRDNGS